MIEDLERSSLTIDNPLEGKELSNNELEYLKECVVPPHPEVLVQRIDEMQDCEPPKALDSDPQFAELIEPIRDKIPSIYLEAPTDMEQVEQISDTMIKMEGLRLDEWMNLSLEQRVELLNELEVKIAEIEHRPACPIEVEDLGEITEKGGQLQGHFGYHSSSTIFSGERIVINSELVKSDNPLFYREVLDTVVHEGRHSYQTYNLEHRETHTSRGDLTNWHINMERYGYQNAQLWGFKAYWMQPIEADARKFAEDVLTAYKNKL